VNAHAVWVTRDFQADWFDHNDLAWLNSNGITPVLIFYYFGDEISQEEVLREYDAYVEWMHRALAVLAGDYPAIVVLEPEFNNEIDGERNVKRWKPFSDLMIQSAAEVRHYMPKARVGVCPGDYRACDLWDGLSPTIPYMDFFAFQELWGSTRTNYLNDDYEDISDFALLYATYLSVVFQKPILLAYLGISTYEAHNDGNHWDKIQADVLRSFRLRLEHFLHVRLFGMLYFCLYDDPSPGGYFGPAGVDWGLIDEKGKPKRAFQEFVELTKAVRQLTGKSKGIMNWREAGAR